MKNSIKKILFASLALMVLSTVVYAAEVKKTPPTAEQLKDRFDRIDKDKDEKLSPDEMKHAMMGKQTFLRYDANEDGFISPEEFNNPQDKVKTEDKEKDSTRTKTFRAN